MCKINTNTEKSVLLTINYKLSTFIKLFLLCCLMYTLTGLDVLVFDGDNLRLTTDFT